MDGEKDCCCISIWVSWNQSDLRAGEAEDYVKLDLIIVTMTQGPHRWIRKDMTPADVWSTVKELRGS